MGGYLVDTNVVLDVVRLVLVAKPLYEAVMKDLKDVESLRQVASAVDGINRRWLVFCF
jgi:predicted regulator of amino acid metabolism with ACT domain